MAKSTSSYDPERVRSTVFTACDSDLNLLWVFDAILEVGSVTRAADRLYRSRPAVSRALARLREQLDDPLLVMAGGRMQPTPFGRDLAERMRPTLRQLDAALRPQEAFDPAQSTRRFSVVIPNLAGVLPTQYARSPPGAGRLGARRLAASPACGRRHQGCDAESGQPLAARAVLAVQRGVIAGAEQAVGLAAFDR